MHSSNSGTGYPAIVAATALLFGVCQSVSADSISGTVVDARTALPVAGISVEVYGNIGSEWLVLEVVTTGQDGTYSAAMAPGTYHVHFADYQGVYAKEYYDGAAELTWATSVTVEAGVGAAGVDATLDPGGSIEGRVRVSGTSTPLPGILVNLYRWDDIWWTVLTATVTDEDGYYAFPGLPAGSYRVQFQDLTGEHVDRVYPYSYIIFLGSTVQVASGEAVSDIDVGMVKGGGIRGIAFAPDGSTPLEGIRVSAYKLTENAWEWMGDDYTASDGAYLIDGLVLSGCRLHFEDPSGNYLDTYHIDADSLETAKDILVLPGLTQNWKNVSMKQPSSVEGRVSVDGLIPAPGIKATAYQWDGHDWYAEATGTSDSNGDYRLTGLHAGTYRVEFTDPQRSFVSRTWPGADRISQGGDIVLPAATTLTGYDADLDVSGLVAGTITALDQSTPLEDIHAFAYAWDGASWVYESWGQTDSNGLYILPSLPPQAYRVEFLDWRGAFLGEVYDNASTLASGAEIVLTNESVAVGIDAALAGSSSFSGVLTMSDGVLPLAGARVLTYAWDGTNWVVWSETWTDGSGGYSVEGLGAGIYRVEFIDRTGTHLSEVYGDAADVAAGTDIVVPAETAVTGIDNALPLPSTLSGKVTNNPVFGGWLSGVKVTVVNLATGERADDITNLFGLYYVHGLRAGDYVVYTEVPQGSAYLDEWYEELLVIPGNGMPPEVTPVAVPESSTIDGIDFSLLRGGQVSGMVTAFDGHPLGAATVSVQGTLATYQGVTDSNGAYQILGIFPGTYQVKVAYTGLADQWWGGASHRDDADDLLVELQGTYSSDLELLSGQHPALAEITSTPPGADIYLDGLATGWQTPALLDVGEVASANTDLPNLLSHRVTVRKAGFRFPAPRDVDAVEAETRSLHFELEGLASGSVEVLTTPSGAEVYVDVTDVVAGVTPCVVTNLSPGVHTLHVVHPGSLRPRPVAVDVTAGATLQVQLPLSAAPSPEPASLEVRTAPPMADVYLNSLGPPVATDLLTDELDPSEFSGPGWTTTPHRVVLRKAGYKAAAPRWVDPAQGTTNRVGIVLLPDPDAMTDDDGDGLPDEWQESYVSLLRGFPPGVMGADQDPDMDGLHNEQEMRLGTHPLDPDSNFFSWLEADGSTYRLWYRAVPGQRYAIQTSDLLLDPGAWQMESGVVTSLDDVAEHQGVLPTGTTHRVYRILVVSP